MEKHTRLRLSLSIKSNCVLIKVKIVDQVVNREVCSTALPITKQKSYINYHWICKKKANYLSHLTNFCYSYGYDDHIN